MATLLLRRHLQELARLRIRGAQLLFDDGEFSGAYHLAGISVECAIKACIAKRSLRHAFPDKEYAIECWKHDLTSLIKTAALFVDLTNECSSNATFNVNWATVSKWKVDSRYDISVNQVVARDYIGAVNNRRNGVLKWLRQYW